MTNIHRPGNGEQPRPRAASQIGNTTGTTHKGWTIRISPDIDLASIRPSHFKLLVILEGLCRDRSYCWPPNETRARLYGCDTSNGASSGFRRLLRELEADGWIS